MKKLRKKLLETLLIATNLLLMSTPLSASGKQITLKDKKTGKVLFKGQIMEGSAKIAFSVAGKPDAKITISSPLLKNDISPVTKKGVGGLSGLKSGVYDIALDPSCATCSFKLLSVSLGNGVEVKLDEGSEELNDESPTTATAWSLDRMRNENLLRPLFENQSEPAPKLFAKAPEFSEEQDAAASLEEQLLEKFEAPDLERDLPTLSSE